MERPLEGLRALVVDDVEDARELVGHVLRRYGAEVRLAESATEARSLLEQFDHDIILSDIGMPEEDGHDFIRSVRAQRNARYRNTPAIAVTAFASEQDRKSALEAGFNDHVTKPVDYQALVSSITTLVAKKPVSAAAR